MSKKISKKSIVEMSHTLNTMRDGYATKQEQRLFLVYLSKINPRFPETLNVRMTLDEFCEICEIENKREIKKLEKITETILQKLVKVRSETGGWANYILFDESKVEQDSETGEWYFELCASKKALFHFVDLKQYVSFYLEYVLKLKSLNQMRMYCILKDYQYQKTFTLELEELRELLSFKPEEYPQYFNFRQDVLEVCQKEITKLTDIKFEYKGIRGKGRGGRITRIEFTVHQNSKNKANEENVIDCSPPPLINDEKTTQPISNTLKISAEQVEIAKNSPLWENAMTIALNTPNITNAEHYATGIILKKQYNENIEDLNIQELIPQQEKKSIIPTHQTEEPPKSWNEHTREEQLEILQKFTTANVPVPPYMKLKEEVK